jgi:sn-glycerol 3-phosphate transport system permease protein
VVLKADFDLPPAGRRALARRLPRSLVIKPSSPRHTFAVIPSHNPGFHKRLNETSATMRKTWLPG